MGFSESSRKFLIIPAVALDVEKRSLAISQKELERKRGLYEKRHIARLELEQEEKRVLAQENTVQNFQSALNLIPAQRRAVLAKMASGRAKLKDNGLDIQKTTIKAPFDCRISEVNVELLLNSILLLQKFH